MLMSPLVHLNVLVYPIIIFFYPESLYFICLFYVYFFVQRLWPILNSGQLFMRQHDDQKNFYLSC